MSENVKRKTFCTLMLLALSPSLTQRLEGTHRSSHRCSWAVEGRTLHQCNTRIVFFPLYKLTQQPLVQLCIEKNVRRVAFCASCIFSRWASRLRFVAWYSHLKPFCNFMNFMFVPSVPSVSIGPTTNWE